MTLLFPNSSRSLDKKRNAVRFTGHDGVFEVRLFVRPTRSSQRMPNWEDRRSRNRSSFLLSTHCVRPSMMSHARLLQWSPRSLHPHCCGFPLRFNDMLIRRPFADRLDRNPRLQGMLSSAASLGVDSSCETFGALIDNKEPVPIAHVR
jgi:hypothetical protein